MIEELIVCDAARIPVVWFVTHEELRAEKCITEYGTSCGKQVWIWSLTSDQGNPGWETNQVSQKQPSLLKTEIISKPPFPVEDSSSPEGAVRTIVKFARESAELGENSSSYSRRSIIAIFRDPHVFLNEDMTFVRTLRDASRELRDVESLIVCLSPVSKLPEELRHDVTVIKPGLPSKETIRSFMKEQLEDYDQSEFTNEDILTNACVGLTLSQSADAIAKSIVQFGKINIDYIQKVKTETISSVPGLTYESEAPPIESVGGLHGLKDWLKERKRGFSEEARKENLPIPRGVLIIGVSGTGKSLLAKAVSSYFEAPLIRLSPPNLKGGIVGETESNLERAQQSITALGHCVCWIDELEKAMPSANHGNLDGGTSDAISGGLLNFMQERKGGAFIVGTANNISALPPELLRKGRWDAIFFVDLPTLEERLEIFKIHLDKRHWILSEEEIQILAEETNNYSGAEIEAACISGKWKAFSEEREMTYEDVLLSIRIEPPLYQTMEEQISELRKWAETRTRSASISKKIERPTIGRIGKRKISTRQLEKVNDGN